MGLVVLRGCQRLKSGKKKSHVIAHQRACCLELWIKFSGVWSTYKMSFQMQKCWRFDKFMFWGSKISQMYVSCMSWCMWCVRGGLTDGCVCCFVLLNQYWGIVMYGPGASLWASQGRRTHNPRLSTSQPHPVPPWITWGVRILTLHLNYVTGYTSPLLFLFKRTHNYYVDNQGLVPCQVCRVGRSKVRSASLVKPGWW